MTRFSLLFVLVGVVVLLGYKVNALPVVHQHQPFSGLLNRYYSNEVVESSSKSLFGMLSTLRSSMLTGENPSSPGPPHIVIAGPPASGKGTQAELICKAFNVVHLSAGDMLRAAVEAGSPVGMAVKDYMDSGKLVPDEIINEVVTDRLASRGCIEQGWLLDGFPRTAKQAAWLKKRGVVVDRFILLKVPDELLTRRVIGRRLDPLTGKIYSVDSFTSIPENIKKCLIQRSDDTEAKATVRLQQYHENIQSVQAFYGDVMTTIDGVGPKKEIFERILDAMNLLNHNAT